MPRQVALLIFLGVIGWLLRVDHQRTKHLSPALWIPILWLGIIASRPVSIWFSLNGPGNFKEVYMEGSPVDRAFYFGCILCAAIVLLRRGVSLPQIFANNPALFCLYGYMAVTCIWSDYPFVSFKRLFKDFGCVLMVLVALTDKDPVLAFQALFARCAYVLIPLSMLFIKYYPELGRAYTRYTYQPICIGVTTDKNALGPLAMISFVVILWGLVDYLKERTTKGFAKDLLPFVVMLGMTLWVLYNANSATSYVTTAVATTIFLALTLPRIRARIQNVGIAIVSIVVVLALADYFFGIREELVQTVGRDTTLTGRTEVWSTILKQPVDPLFGVGFWSFWMGDRSEELFEDFYWRATQAHNGFLETYLDGGLIGVGFLLIFLFASWLKVRRAMPTGGSFGAVKCALFFVIILSNMTEASFMRMLPVWLMLLACSVSPGIAQEEELEYDALNGKNPTVAEALNEPDSLALERGT